MAAALVIALIWMAAAVLVGLFVGQLTKEIQ